MADDEKQTSFTVKDRRQFTTDGERRATDEADTAQQTAAKTETRSRPDEQTATAPDAAKDESKPATGPEAIDFASFITSLSTAALLYLGEFENPETKQRELNLPYARHHIDLISMLQAKTKGNLTPDESRLVEVLLTELRMKYVKASS